MGWLLKPWARPQVPHLLYLQKVPQKKQNRHLATKCRNTWAECGTLGPWASCPVQSIAGSRFSPYSSRFYQTVISFPWRREGDSARLKWVESAKEETELNSVKVARNVSGGGWRERAHPCAFMACNTVKKWQRYKMLYLQGWFLPWHMAPCCSLWSLQEG